MVLRMCKTYHSQNANSLLTIYKTGINSSRKRSATWRVVGELPPLRSSASRTISKTYLVVYQDGIRRHIDREERDTLHLSGLLRNIGPRKYKFIGKVAVFRRTATQNTIEQLERSVTPMGILKRFLAMGQIVFEFNGRRYIQPEETVEGMTCRMQAENG